MPCQALLVTTRTYSRHFESLYPVWWNWGFAPSENKIAKTINLQWSYSIHQRFLFHLLYFLCLCIYLYACFLFLLACGNGTSVLKTVLRGCLLLCIYFWGGNIRQFYSRGAILFLFLVICTPCQETVYFCITLHQKLGECVISRFAHLHIWQRCVPPLNPHWHCANQHHYIVTNMEIQHYTLFCDCLCNKSPAESSSPPSLLSSGGNLPIWEIAISAICFLSAGGC